MCIRWHLERFTLSRNFTITKGIEKTHKLPNFQSKRKQINRNREIYLHFVPSVHLHRSRHNFHLVSRRNVCVTLETRRANNWNIKFHYPSMERLNAEWKTRQKKKKVFQDVSFTALTAVARCNFTHLRRRQWRRLFSCQFLLMLLLFFAPASRRQIDRCDFVPS